MNKQTLLYTGKAKSVYSTDDPAFVIIEFRNDTSAFDGAKLAKLDKKGMVNNYFNAFIMEKLAIQGIATHFEKLLSKEDALVQHLEMIPVECVVRNVTAGNLAKRLGLEEGLALTPPVFEFYLKSDALHDPLINEYHIQTFKWATEQEVDIMKTLSFKINSILLPLFAAAGLMLVDYKLEFGRSHGKVILGDEFTPDGCRLWDTKTKEKFDKDRFRRDLGSVVEYYEQAAKRLGVDLEQF